MELLQFEDLGDTECHFAANAVVLVPEKYQISIAKYLKEASMSSGSTGVDAAMLKP